MKLFLKDVTYRQGGMKSTVKKHTFRYYFTVDNLVQGTNAFYKFAYLRWGDLLITRLYQRPRRETEKKKLSDNPYVGRYFVAKRMLLIEH